MIGSKKDQFMAISKKRCAELISVIGFAGDQTQEAMSVVVPFCEVLSKALNIEYRALGGIQDIPEASGWCEVLKLAQPTFDLARDAVRTILEREQISILVTPRCAVSLATLPEVLRRHPDAVVVWLDAHGDLNTPATGSYLGGMPVAAAMGEWESGYGSGLPPESFILVGARNLDPAEVEFIEKHHVAQYVVGDGLSAWKKQIAFAQGRPIYVHMDVDAFDPSEVTGEFKEPNGLMRGEVVDLLAHLAGIGDVVGVEIAEFQPQTPDEFEKGASTLAACLGALLSLHICDVSL